MAQLKDRADVAFFAHIAAIAQLSDQRQERALPGGLSLAGFSALNQLTQFPDPPTPIDIARAVRVSKGAMTNTLQRLEAQRLVKIEGDGGDGRKKRISLTAEGAELHREALTALRPRLEALRGAFDPDHFAAALPFLGRVRDWLESDA